LHFDVARAFIEEGFHVVCDKPMTTNLEDAETLCRLVEEQDVVFALTHNYSGYPMVKQARDLVQAGALGTIRKVVVEYPQGWLAAPIEQESDKQASWRTDPEQAGAGALGDIGSHAEHLARYVTGLRMSELFAEATSFVEGRRLEDDANLLVRYEGGAKGLLYCSQVSVGEENNLRLRVYGTDASLEWHQEHPNYLSVLRPDGPEEIYKRGNEYLSEAAQANGARIPPGHPEGFIEAFANVYRAAAADIAASLGGDPAPDTFDYPTVRDGAAGVHFIETALESSRQEAWLDARYDPPGV
jgi:predicted dehydrogenase